jgi:protein SCO1/2
MIWLLVAFVMLIVPEVVQAKSERIHGVVLALTPQKGEVIVRHDAFDSMPSMTMSFQIVPRERIRQLQPGNAIDATVDTATEPWTLSHVTVSSSQPVTSEVPMRRVTPLHIGDIVPDVPFVDQNGKPFRFSQWRGSDIVLAFIYTRCQDARMCPLISGKFHALQQKAGGRALHLVEVTLDPSYDRPDVLARYGRMFGANPKRWSLVVGDADPTLDFAARFGVTAFPDPNIGIIHSENTVEIDADGRIQNMLTDTAWQPDEVLADIDARNGIASNPFERFNLWLSKAAVAMCGNNVAAFSGVGDLAVVVLIFAAFGYLFYRIARGIIRA